MLAKDIKSGTAVVYNGQPCLIRSFTVHTPSARGAATLYKYRAMNLTTSQKVDITLKGGESLDEADFVRKPAKLMYTDSEFGHFLDQEDFNQYALPIDSVCDDLQYITEETEGVLAMIYNDNCIGIQIPLTVELKVTQCDPAARGNSATSRTKPATVETNLVVQVPEYLANGETIKVDTQTGKFLSRA